MLELPCVAAWLACREHWRPVAQAAHALYSDVYFAGDGRHWGAGAYSCRSACALRAFELSLTRGIKLALLCDLHLSMLRVLL